MTIEKFNIKNYQYSQILSLITFVAIYSYYFWLSYTVPLLSDDLEFRILSDLRPNDLYLFINKWLKLNARLGTLLFGFMHYFSIPYYAIMPFLHMANLILGYYLIKGKKLNIFSLSHMKEFSVLFTLYTFLNAAPFQGIVWWSGTICNNFGFPFVLLFFIYIKELLINTNLSLSQHIGYLLASYLAGWSQESVLAHILASAIFICLYFYINGIKIISYLWIKKVICLAYILVACGWLSQAIVTNFWTIRLGNHRVFWKFYENITPIPAIIKVLFLVEVILLLYYFLNHKKISDKNQKIISYTFILTILNLLTCLVNLKTFGPRAFFYHSFIAGGILYYIYINFITTTKKLFLNKIFLACMLYITLNAGYLLAYNTSLEKYCSRYVFDLLEKNNASEINLPDTQSIPSKLFFSNHIISLSKLAKKNLYLLHKLGLPNLYGYYQNQFKYSDTYLKMYYPDTKIRFVSYKEFIEQKGKD